LRGAVAAALRAASISGGLVDPTLLGALRRAGYAASRAQVAPASLAQALQGAPPRRPARPDPAARWRTVEVDDAAGVIRRPPGVELDLGGSAKGWAADLIAARLGRLGRFAVDCGGDVRVSARRGAPWEVRVADPLTGGVAHTLHLRSGGVATSGLDAKLWQREDGAYAHHLIDPSTGDPAWTGLIAATAVAPTALEAEALAKVALLAGPRAGRSLLHAKHGGVLVHDDGAVDPVEPRRSLRQRARRSTHPRASIHRARPRPVA
jgi:thiamine biosynthesis lipoprotein